MVDLYKQADDNMYREKMLKGESTRCAILNALENCDCTRA